TAKPAQGTMNMHARAAYQQSRSVPTTRIDLILSLYQKALANLDCARQHLAERRPEKVASLLLKTQTIVMALASGLPAHKDETAVNSLRLYESVAYQLARGPADNIAAAARVLGTLREAFEAVHDQAAALEAEGKIPPLDQNHYVSLTA